MSEVPDHELLTVSQVARIYGVPRSTVYIWLEKGLGHKVLPNGFYQILREDVELYTRQHAIKEPWRILIADDDVTFLESSRIILEKAGFKCICSDNVVDAILKVRKFKPDLLVLDINFPQKSGFDIADASRRENFGDVPILFVSGEVSGKEVLDKAMDQNCYGFLEKPFEPEKILNQVNYIFKQQGKNKERR